MQNSATYGKIAETPYRISIPTKVPEEVKLPDIRSRTTQKFTDKDMEYSQTERPENYEIFQIQKIQKKDKRTTCLGQGSVEYCTMKPK